MTKEQVDAISLPTECTCGHCDTCDTCRNSRALRTSIGRSWKSWSENQIRGALAVLKILGYDVK